MPDLQVFIRDATPDDMSDVLKLITELAIYEKAPNAVVNSVEALIKDGFSIDKSFDCVVAEILNEGIVGFALFFTGYSTWKGKTLYLEDLLVTQKFRGLGIGKKLFLKVKEEAINRNVRRMDWQVLDWNEPAITFYKKLGASLDPEWINGRFFFETD